jgi:DNA-3-methyladenine glycosylase II
MSEISARHHAILPAAAPFSFDLSVRALAGFTPCSADHAVVDGRVRRAFSLPARSGAPGVDGAVVVEVAAAPAPASGVALTVFAADPLDRSQALAVERAVAQWLGLDDDMRDFLAVAAADPPMARLLQVAYGLHQVRFSSLAEGTVYFTLTQRSTQWFATARKRRIAAERGSSVVLDGTAFTAFPTLDALSRLTDAELLDYAGNRHRGERLRTVIAGVAALDETWLRTAPYDEARRALLSVPGVGTFTAHAILLRALGRPDDAPVEMAQFTLAARAVYGDPPPRPAEIRERYTPWLGWWAYLVRTAAEWLPAQQVAA